MSDCYVLTNNQHGQKEEIPCEDLLSGLVTYGNRIVEERAALRGTTPTGFGSRYFFVAIYDGGKQVSWTIRHLQSNGEWEETTSWRFNGENEMTHSTGIYRVDEVHRSMGELAELMARADNSDFEAGCYRSTYEALELEYAALTAE